MAANGPQLHKDAFEIFIEDQMCGVYSKGTFPSIEETWDAAIKFMEAKFTSTNTGSPKLPEWEGHGRHSEHVSH